MERKCMSERERGRGWVSHGSLCVCHEISVRTILHGSQGGRGGSALERR